VPATRYDIYSRNSGVVPTRNLYDHRKTKTYGTASRRYGAVRPTERRNRREIVRRTARFVRPTDGRANRTDTGPPGGARRHDDKDPDGIADAFCPSGTQKSPKTILSRPAVSVGSPTTSWHTEKRFVTSDHSRQCRVNDAASFFRSADRRRIIKNKKKWRARSIFYTQRTRIYASTLLQRSTREEGQYIYICSTYIRRNIAVGFGRSRNGVADEPTRALAVLVPGTDNALFIRHTWCTRVHCPCAYNCIVCAGACIAFALFVA